MQLFDCEESMASAVASFLLDGVDAGQALLVAVTRRHWTAIGGELRQHGCDPEELQRRERLTVVDTDDALASFMRRGAPVAALFEQTVAATVKRLAQSGGGLRIYGEMVELLAQDGNYAGAAQLEELWNELGADYSFTLLCGYSSAHFAGPDAGSALQGICCQHSTAVCSPSDPLGEFLIGRMRASGTSATA